MPDREKVIKGLECCKIPFTKCFDGGCPYFENDGCKASLKADALALLKAQEPRTVLNIFNAHEGVLGNCPTCSSELIKYYNKTCCGSCGQAVKWDG